MRWTVFFMCYSCLFSWSFAASLTTPMLIARTMSGVADCAHYQIVGGCAWLDCSLGGCHQSHTLKVQHYTPELLVFTYPKVESIPWLEYRVFRKPLDSLDQALYFKQTGQVLSDGHLEGAEGALQEISFLEAAVVGHPALMSLPGFFLKGKSSPGAYYFNSWSDAKLWRDHALESELPESQLDLPAWRIGSGWDLWGTVYPRTGFVMQTDLNRAAATIAVRALNIVTDSRMLHLAHYLWPLPCPYSDCVAAPPIDGGNQKVEYQLVFPESSKQCSASIALALEQFPTLESKGILVWTVWREYKACLPGSGKFLYSWG